MRFFLSRPNSEINRPLIGLDISDGSLELAEVRKNQGNYSLITYGRLILTANTIVHGLIHDKKRLSESIKKLYADRKIVPDGYNVACALPDSQVLIKRFPVSHKKSPSYEYLDALAERSFTALGINVTGAVRRWTYQPTGNKSGQFTLYVTKANYINQWLKFFSSQGMNLISLEIQSLAVTRSLVYHFRRNQVISLLDFGFRSTSFSIVQAGELLFSQTTDLGGYDLTKSLAGQLQRQYDEAEMLKQKHGISDPTMIKIVTLLEGKIDQIITQLDLLRTLNQSNVGEITMTGGGSLMPGLVPYLSKKLQINFRLGRLWLDRTNKNNALPGSSVFPHNDALLYAGAVGLAVGGLISEGQTKAVNFIDR